jgi:hypothetical protein
MKTMGFKRAQPLMKTTSGKRAKLRPKSIPGM